MPQKQTKKKIEIIKAKVKEQYYYEVNLIMNNKNMLTFYNKRQAFRRSINSGISINFYRHYELDQIKETQT